ncbi:MAG: sulfotransferase family 2 domain-containing protein, partial [Bdellovibrionales bacterium]|nr:sulfotransferase family 2 domain-containing protein [Bdellovibrionales bacterium]
VHWNSQYLTVFDENFQPVPQVIGHYDKLNDELPEICNSLGIKCPISNQSGSKRTEPYTSFYTDETREYVAKRYHLDIEIFQFSYGENSQTQGTK